MPDVPPDRADRRLLLVTGGFLLIAGVFFAGVLWLATQRDDTPSGAFFIGLERPLKSHIHEGSPLYFANPGAGDGFWLDVEDGHLVALVLARPGTRHCVVKWKDQRDAYLDCNGNPLQTHQLDRYTLAIGPRNGSPKRSVYVNLHKTSPAPG